MASTNGIIRRIVQLVLDRVAAARMEADARKSLGAVEGSLSTLRAAAVKLGAVLAAAFGIRAIIRFGEESVKQALAGEKAWSALAGSIDNAGGNFAAAEKDLRALSEAFRDATIHSGDAYAETLSRIITLTGDVSASTNNMGLVANVAAQFFSGDLAPAGELVAKVMNGQTTALQRMGIHVKSAQEGLELLASRSFGAAERQAGTFGGKLAQVTNLWNDFKQSLGEVLTQSGETVGALDVLRGGIIALTRAVKDNRDELNSGLKKAMRGTVEGLDGIYRGVRGVVELLGGAFFFVIGAILSPLVLLNKGLALLAEGAGHVTGMLGMQGASKALDDFRKRVDDLAVAMSQPTRVGLEMMGEGLKRFSERTQLAEDVLAGLGRPGGKAGPLKTSPPGLGKNAVGEPGEKIEGADFVDERLDRIHDAIERAFKQSDNLKALQKNLRDTVGAFEDSQDAAQTMAEAMQGDIGQAIDPVGTQLRMLDDEAARLTSTMQQLAELGMSATDPIMQQYANRLKEINAGMRRTQQEARLMADVASLAGEVVGASLDGGLGPFARIKAKVNLIRAAEETAEGIAAAFSLLGAVNAPGHFAAAAKFVAIAGAWAAIGGGVGGGGGVAGGHGGAGLASARAASGGASREAVPSQNVSIFLVGPGFDALNPEVQKVVWGAEQVARERFGKNAKVRVVRRP